MSDRKTFIFVSALLITMFGLAGTRNLLAAQAETKVEIKKTNVQKEQAKPASNYYYWDPFMEMELQRRRMNQLFSHFDHSLFNRPFANQNQTTGLNLVDFNPNLSFEDTGKEYLVSLDLPGLEKDAINIELKEKLLTISGERKIAREEENDQGFYRSERSYGSFHRSLNLPEDADENKIEADYKNGVLEIQIAKSKEKVRKARKIPVRS